ncbi:MFS transporter [Paraburkholderia unamae]|uniref:Transmembrane secretion effector n=1 Tax=Paraburkholderia unamae TaxID=219649 RepID=A0ABX5K6G3_9BURK|nr:MFS transporter [Paraburkholderia unamae]PVX61034.1 transmembrane secretion effector [Paraburkholderia unamae]
METKGHEMTYRRLDLHAYLGLRFLAEASSMALSVMVGWTVYDISRTPLSLGIVGIVEFIPALLLTLPAGELCDRLSPRLIIVASLALECVCSFAFLTLHWMHWRALWLFYGVVLASGLAKAFAEPAVQAMLPCLVRAGQLPRAVAFSSTAWQMAVVLGPVVGGLAYAINPALAYLGCAAAWFAAMLLATTLRARQVAFRANTSQGRMDRVWAGVRFVWSQPVVLGALSLDLFSVLLGGATALLPVYARDILKVGPEGLGMLRSAPAIGACIVGLALSRFPPERRAGSKLFAAVIVFGIFTVVFAFARSPVVAWIALAVIGASDMVSVNIRTTLIQLVTPDAMRGRVSAVNALFIGASSQLGAFESGVVAALLGAIPTIALGGFGTIVVALAWMLMFPDMRKADRLDMDLNREGVTSGE